MKIAVIGLLLCFGSAVFAGELKRADRFESVEAFVAAVKGLVPASEKGEIASLFSVKEPGQPEDPKTGTQCFAEKVESCEVLYVDGTSSSQDEASVSLALVFAKVQPPTEATRSEVGVFFLLSRQKNRWRVADLLRFQALGKYSGIEVNVTSTGNHGKTCPDFVTVTEHQGGRGYSYEISATYKCEGLKFKKVDLK